MRRSPPSSGRRLPRLVLAVSGALAVLITACEPQIRWEDAPAVGERAPDYTVLSLEGEPAGLDDFSGRPVLLNFWATWCTPCRTETPFLQSIHERYRDQGLQVVGVSMDSPDSHEDIRSFMEEMGVTYEILYDPRQVATDRFSLIGLPVTFILDSETEIRFVRVGPVSENDEEFMDALEEVSS